MKKFLAFIIFILMFSTLTFAGEGYRLSPDLIDLPWLRGSETANDLEFAASSNDELKALLKDMASQTDVCELYNNFDLLISKWLGENKSGEEMQKLVLSKLMKKDIVEFETYKPENIQMTYQLWKEHWFLNFVFQMEWRYKLGVKYEYSDDKLVYSDTIYENIIKNMTNGDDFLLSYLLAKKLAVHNELDLDKLGSAIKKLGYGAHIISYINSKKDFETKTNSRPLYFMGTKGNDKIKGNDEPDIIYGRDGNDILEGYGGDDWLSGGKGNDKLYGGDGSDILIGNEGNNELYGGGGDDIYIYNGEGNDIICDEKWATVKVQQWYWDSSISDYRDKWVDDGKVLVQGGNDTVIFGNNITKDKLTIKRLDNNLVFKINDTGNTLRINNWYSSAEQRIENFKFSDGTQLDVSELWNITKEKDYVSNIFEKVCLYFCKIFVIS